MTKFRIGADDSAWIDVDVQQYERACSGEFYDDNWLTCHIEVRAGAFRGRFPTSLLTTELLDLHARLVELYESLKGTFAFSAMEGQIELHFSCDDRGHIHVKGVVTDESGIGHRLSCYMSFDQTWLQRLVSQLGRVVLEYPIRR